MFARAWLSIAGVLLLAGCDWVDSAGDDSNAAPVPQIQSDGSELDGPIVLDERDSTTLAVVGLDADGSVQAWRWSETPVETGALDACASVDGFDSTLALELDDACAAPGCDLVFEQQAGDEPGSTGFVIDAPVLQAPVGVVHTLTAIDDQGAEGSQDYTFCLLSVNEPPLAADDSFSMLEGTRLVVEGDELNLLSNDIDDIDAANEALRVITVPARTPSAASLFELGADGGFSYAFAGTNLGGDIVDSFDYTITDGRFESTATATIRIVPRDDPPELVSRIPVLVATAGIEYEAALAQYFADPEEADLAFSLVEDNSLPEGFTLSRTGVVGGRAGLTAVGEYPVAIEVSDGTFAVVEEIVLSVVENLPVVVDTIPAQPESVGRLVRFSAGRFFTDPEFQPIEYTLEVRDPDANLGITARTGVVTGFITAAGEYRVSISADDGVTAPTVADVLFVVAP